MSKRNVNKSGWHTSENGQQFHAYGGDMSDETIAALGKLAEAAAKMLDERGATPDAIPPDATWRSEIDSVVDADDGGEA